MIALNTRLACISLIGLCAGYAATAGLHAQTASGNCGIATWSQADQRYSVLPCTPPTTQTADGKASCGVATWSLADQTHTVFPCSATAYTNGAGECTLLTWSQADQRYVMIPCELQGKDGAAAPVHFGE